MMAGMELLPGDLRRTLPALYSQEHVADPLVRVKFFTPDSGFTWYVVECDGEDLCFGLVAGQAVELGYFRLAELQALRGPLGLAVERDLGWTPRPLSWVREHLP